MRNSEGNVIPHCREIDRCNQRGGRMFSIVDLIEAGTMTPDLAAYLLAAIQQGASFMVGALPGGAGKTTVMGALLNFVPDDIELVPADGDGAFNRGIASPTPPRCFICHEIGPGPYYAYLWGEELRQYFRLASVGHMLATNLHADTYEQARDQICRVNKVPESDLRRVNLMLFLSVTRGRRRVEQVWESDGTRPHNLIYETGSTGPAGRCLLVSAPGMTEARQIIDRLTSDGSRTIEEVRTVILRAARK